MSNTKTLFVTGTDTDIGKTIVSALLVNYFIREGERVAYYKPIQTGCSKKNSKGDLIAPDAEFVKECCEKVSIKASYCFSLAATPELAAKQENIKIDFNKIAKDFTMLKETHDVVIVEGAGGLFVPVQDKKTVADLIHFLNIPTLLVSQNKLGTINHSCLSLFYGQAKKVKFVGFVFNNHKQTRAESEVERTNAEFISDYSTVPYLGEIPSMAIKNGTNQLEFEDEQSLQQVMSSLSAKLSLLAAEM